MQKMERYLIFSIILSVILSTQAWQCPEIKVKTATDESRLFKGQQKFSIDFLHSVLKIKSDKNFFFSPYSIYRALLLAYAGSDNATQDILAHGLNLEWSHDKNEVLTEYKHERTERQRNSKLEAKLEFDSVDKFYFDKSVEVRDCIKTLFSDEIETLDMQNKPDEARDHINEWVDKVSRGNIKDIIPEGNIDSSTKLAIANAAYFKGLWQTKFEESKTKKEDFHRTPTEKVSIEMMSQTNELCLKTNTDINARILEIPYLSSSSAKTDISFIIVLPQEDKEGALNEVLEKITSDTLPSLFTRCSESEVDVKLPKFIFKKRTPLVPILKDMGLGQVFSVDADYSGFSESSRILFNDAIHKAKIEVDESGSRAAAGTVISSNRVAKVLPPVAFHANRPFFFMIHDFKTEAILFAGVYRGPE